MASDDGLNKSTQLHYLLVIDVLLYAINLLLQHSLPDVPQ
jgi:hypothetical protein